MLHKSYNKQIVTEVEFSVNSSFFNIYLWKEGFITFRTEDALLSGVSSISQGRKKFISCHKVGGL